MENKMFCFKNGACEAQINVNEILFVERYLRKLRIVTREKEYECYEKLKNVIPYLNQNFYPCLQGCYINFDHVNEMEKQKITFDGNHCLYLGRTNFHKTKKAFRDYLKKDTK